MWNSCILYSNSRLDQYELEYETQSSIQMVPLAYEALTQACIKA